MEKQKTIFTCLSICMFIYGKQAWTIKKKKIEMESEMEIVLLSVFFSITLSAHFSRPFRKKSIINHEGKIAEELSFNMQHL